MAFVILERSRNISAIWVLWHQVLRYLIASISCMWLTEKRIIRANQITSRSMKSYWEFLKIEHSVQLKMTIPSIWRNRPNLRGTKKGQLNSKPRLNVLRQIYRANSTPTDSRRKLLKIERRAQFLFVR